MYWGSTGVDLFFPISGFIMTLIVPSYEVKGGWKTFIKKRAIRILPIYYLICLIAVLKVVITKEETVPLDRIIKSLFTFPFINNSKLLLGVAWTLAYELYFYIIIALLLLVSKNKVIVKGLVIMLTLPALYILFSPTSAFFNFILNPLLLEFGLGIIAGICYKHLTKGKIASLKFKWLSVIIIILGLTMVIGRIFYRPESFNFFGLAINKEVEFYRVILSGMPCTILLFGVVLSEFAYRYSVPRLLVLIGDASYSCYLIHVYIYLATAQIVFGLKLGLLTYYLAVFPLCYTLSILFYKTIEAPVIKRLNKIW
jgi:peptidoglycan/LPS O-acetylase OafA/YrhL